MFLNGNNNVHAEIQIMMDCRLCAHHKALYELSDLVDCHAPMPRNSIVPAFYAFYEKGRVNYPFTVIRRDEVSANTGSWPLRYQFDSIFYCSAFEQVAPPE